MFRTHQYPYHLFISNYCALFDRRQAPTYRHTAISAGILTVNRRQIICNATGPDYGKKIFMRYAKQHKKYMEYCIRIRMVSFATTVFISCSAFLIRDFTVFVVVDLVGSMLIMKLYMCEKCLLWKFSKLM